MNMMNPSFNTTMKFSTLIRILIVSSLIILLPQSLSYADPAEGRGRDVPVPSQQQSQPKTGNNSVPVPPETKAQLSSGGEGSVPGAAGPGAKSVTRAPSTGKPSSSASAPVKKSVKKEKKTVYRPPTVLERFRDYRGERTPAAFMALFDQQQMIGFRQEPPVVLSDGKAVVRLKFVSTPERENISDVALSGGRVLAAMKDPEATNMWIIEVVPEKGTYETAMALLQRGVLMVFPVAVAPPVNIDLNKSGDVTEEDFRIFLHDRGTPPSPVSDLNGDGIRDFRDDYLFTANYLALNPAPETRATTSPHLMPAGPGVEDESLYETGDTVEPLPPEVEPEEEDGSPGQ